MGIIPLILICLITFCIYEGLRGEGESSLPKANEGQCCNAGVYAFAVQSPQPLKVLSKLVAEKAESVKSERIIETPDGGGESTEAKLRSHLTLSVRIRPALPFQILEKTNA